MMKRQQRLRLKLLFLMLIAFLWLGCPDPAPPVNDEAPNSESLFWPEYDYMAGFDVFNYGHTYASNVFDNCNTDFDPKYDDRDLYSEVLDYRYLATYAYEHGNQDGNNFDNKCYIVAIKDATEKPEFPGHPEWVVLGVTKFAGEEGAAMTFIFVEAIVNKYPYNFEWQTELEKTVIHELGHMRADLTHLCFDDGSGLRPEHNNYTCVMGRSKIIECTNREGSKNFCTNDCDKLKTISW